MTDEQNRYIATCKLGLERVVADELRALDIQVHAILDARVFFRCDGYDLARALLYLRAAERVLLVVGTFEATSFEALFEGVKGLDWKRYLPRDAYIHVNGKSAKSKLFSVSDCQSITKKAIVESLRAAYKTQIIPETGKEIIVEVGLLKDEVTLALDACGAGLSRRGYRTYNVPAPLSETLGAGLVLLSRFRGDRPLLDPMCGSGTIPIEAAMIAARMAPGANRNFACEDWPFLPRDAFVRAREQASDCVVQGTFEIMGSDIDAHSISLCKKHAKKAGVMLKWAVCPLKELSVKESGGILITNPPYGERLLTAAQTQSLYHDMRKAFDVLDAWSVHIISAYREFERAYGRRADKRRKLSNGGMPCTFYQYFPRKN